MRFDIDGIVNRPGMTRKMIAGVVRDKRARTRTNERDRWPGPDVPLLAADEIPDFEVVIVLSKLDGNKHEAGLRWFLLGDSGEFPVIPAEDHSANEMRTSTMQAYQFDNPRQAVVEAAQQAAALTDNFIEWATQGDPDAVQP